MRRCDQNFSSGICEPLSARLRVFPVPEVGWSDWGSVERILTSLKQMGKLEDGMAPGSGTTAEAKDLIPTWSMANRRRMQDLVSH